jgi:hypothetical protein
MSKETTTILRSILYHIMSAESKEDALTAVEAMCSEDDVTIVRAKFEEKQKRNKNAKKTVQ